MKPIRVLLADDHRLVRAGLHALLQQISGVQIVGEAGDGYEALQLSKTSHPDIVLMDLVMPRLNGLEATARVRRACPQVRVIILSVHDTPDYVAQALQAGATGYLLKAAEQAELALALRAVARGETYLSPAVSTPIITEYLRHLGGKGKRGGGEPSPAKLLTSRQREILQLIVEGRTTKEIATLLQLSTNTVITHRKQMMKRLGMHDIAGLVRVALRRGIVPPDR
jgi:DNA-binding NarL/FixJ family response regulator